MPFFSYYLYDSPADELKDLTLAKLLKQAEELGLDETNANPLPPSLHVLSSALLATKDLPMCYAFQKVAAQASHLKKVAKRKLPCGSNWRAASFGREGELFCRVLEAFSAAGADPFATSPLQWNSEHPSPACRLAQQGFLEGAKRLLKVSPVPWPAEKVQDMALVAAECGELQFVEWALTLLCDFDHTDSDRDAGASPCCWRSAAQRASDDGNFYFVHAILGSKKTQNIAASSAPRTSVQFLMLSKLLEQVDANSQRQLLNQRDGAGNTPLFYLCSKPSMRCTSIDEFAVFDEVLRLGGDCGAVCCTSTGQAPLHVVVQHGMMNKIRRLLEQPDIDVDARDISGNTPLLVAARRAAKTQCRLEILRLLISHGAKTTAVNNFGCTALIFATQSAHNGRPFIRDVVDTLLPWQDATKRDECIKQVAQVSQSHLQWNVLHFAARWGNAEIMSILLRSIFGEDGCSTEAKHPVLDAQDSCGCTPLHVAAGVYRVTEGRPSHHNAAMDLLIDRRANLHLGTTSEIVFHFWSPQLIGPNPWEHRNVSCCAKFPAGTTFMHGVFGVNAESLGTSRALRVCYDHIHHARDSLGRTMLHVAILHNNCTLPVVTRDKISLDVVNAQDTSFQTPLVVCCKERLKRSKKLRYRYDHTEYFITTFLESGADPLIVDDCGMTAFAYWSQEKDLAQVFFNQWQVGLSPYVRKSNEEALDIPFLL